LKNSRHEIWDDDEKILRAVEWRDMVVLLRSPRGKSEIFAKQFERADVPLAVARGGFFDSAEILDLLSLLQLLDNPLQDVPCIAVLRSPLVGCSLDELAEIRLAAKGHFWFALNEVQSPGSGVQSQARAKAGTFLERFHRWRNLAKQSSLSQCLETILSETHYDDWLKSRPRGAQRHANVGQILNLAQKFDQFQRQGLYHFLKFIEAQREAGIEPEVAPVAEENAVRLMSIHQSKGLEFPVVTLADLGKEFNEQDWRGEIILDERFGLCPRVKPPSSGGSYPSLSYWLAQKNQRRELRGEEMRLLYVALTRARDMLVLSAGISERKWKTLWTQAGEITPQKIVAAKSYADWLGLWFAQHAGGATAMEGELMNLRWRIADDTELALEPAAEKIKEKVELQELDDATMQRLRENLTWHYAFGAATERAAKSSVTALRRAATDEPDDEVEQLFPQRRFQQQAGRGARSKLSAADAGLAHHKFLQFVALENAGELTALEAEAERLETAEVLSADERASLDLNAIAAFWNSDAGQAIRSQAANVKRELAFTAKFSPAELDEILERESAPLENEFIVVQGIVDLVVLLPGEIRLVDFKTDEIRANELPEKIKIYAPQLKLYARALAKIYSRPVTDCRLHFLTARRTEKI
jgi:ATP-dependent helicase/nuclease subunit A